MTAIDVVNAYTEAFDAHDMETVRSLLDDDFHFDGPLMKAGSAEEFFQGLADFPMQARTVVHRVIGQGTSVSRVFDFEISEPVQATVPMAEWLEVRNGKITSARLFYDTALFPKP